MAHDLPQWCEELFQTAILHLPLPYHLNRNLLHAGQQTSPQFLLLMSASCVASIAVYRCLSISLLTEIYLVSTSALQVFAGGNIIEFGLLVSSLLVAAFA